MFIGYFGICLGVIVALSLLPGAAAAQAMFSPFIGTKAEIASRMIALADPKPGETVADLGSGDGRLVIGAVKDRPGVKGFGVDIDAKLVREATARAWTEDIGDRARFMHQNVFDADLRQVDVIFMWLFPELQRLLRNKILAEARPGTRIVTQTFDLGAWQPDRVDSEQDSVRMWIVPANIGGNWNWTLVLPSGLPSGRPGGRKTDYAAIVDQHFQQVDAVVRVDKQRRMTRMFTIRGDEVAFSITIPVPGLPNQDHDFAGKVRGNVMTGVVRLRGPFNESTGEYGWTELPWRATRGSRTRYFDPTGVPLAR